MDGKIYGICNKSNGKLYVGQTILDLKQRFYRHTAKNNTNKNMLISKAIQSLGKESFEIFLIKGGIDNHNDLNAAEVYYIEKYNTIAPNGYNTAPGGQKWRRKPNISDSQIKTAALEYENGSSLRELSKKYNAWQRTLSNRFKEMGVIIRDRNHKLPDRTSILTEEIMIDLYQNQKKKIKEIASIYNVDEVTVRRARRRFGIDK